MFSTPKNFAIMAATALLTLGLPCGQAKEITVDATNSSTTLSALVADVYALEDGPDIINIKVDSLLMDSAQIVLDKPITINGDADANGEKCDILVGVDTIRADDSLSEHEKSYIKIQSGGDVTISDLQIHPNFDNDLNGNKRNRRLVDAIRMHRQADYNTTPTHTLSRVWVSGSNADDNYVRLDTADDLFTSGGVKRWSRTTNANDHGVIHVSKSDTLGTGTYNAILDNCHAGMGFGEALNIPAEDGHVTVIGGVYGHSGNNGIRVSGDTVTLTGSHTNRLRIVNVPNFGGTDSHGIFNATGTFDKVEWVDIASINTGRNVQVNGGIPMPMSNCRLMGSLSGSGNPMLYLTHNNSSVNMVDCTLVGSATNNNPVEIRAGCDVDNFFTNCVFVSDNFGQIANKNSDSTGTAVFTNCALPTDGVLGESLNPTEPIFMEPGIDPPNYTETGTVAVSPNFMLTLEDYDWSEAQGEGEINNSRGNTNVYRPQAEAYLGASNDGSNLVGGAGDYPARIDASEWMLM